MSYDGRVVFGYQRDDRFARAAEIVNDTNHQLIREGRTMERSNGVPVARGLLTDGYGFHARERSARYVFEGSGTAVVRLSSSIAKEAETSISLAERISDL